MKIDAETLMLAVFSILEQAPDEESARAAIARLGEMQGEGVQEARRREGEVWQGQSGRYFTIKSGHAVPTAGPGSAAGGTAEMATQRGSGYDQGEPAEVAGKASTGTVAPAAQRARAVQIASQKFELLPRPSAEQVMAARAGMDRLGANAYRKTLVGNKYDRERRRNKLLAEFGDGTTCPCLYCGVLVGHGTLEQDKILTTAQGGRYTAGNIVPACSRCNKIRGDKPFDEALELVKQNA